MSEQRDRAAEEYGERFADIQDKVIACDHFAAGHASRDAEVAALREENERLKAFIIKVKNSSQCAATVLVAGQVLAGHDIRAASEPKDTLGGGK